MRRLLIRFFSSLDSFKDKKIQGFSGFVSEKSKILETHKSTKINLKEHNKKAPTWTRVAYRYFENRTSFVEQSFSLYCEKVVLCV